MPAVPEFLKNRGIHLPLIAAPMAGVSTPALAAAVSNAGGLGSLGFGASDVAQARSMIAQTRAATGKAFNVNFFCHAPAIRNEMLEAAWLERLAGEFARFNAEPPKELKEIYTSFLKDQAMQNMVLEERPAVVSFHFGLPEADYIAALKQAGMTVLASATSLSEAQKAVQAGVDAIVAQGSEAGGHRGIFEPNGPDEMLDTQTLTHRLVQALPVPIIAAGGIMDGGRIKSLLDSGAAAAQLGTAFVLCDESAADAGYRKAFSTDATQRTVLTRVISGRPARCLGNRFTDWGASIADSDIPAYPCVYDAGKALNAAAKAAGEAGYGAQWAGQGAPAARAMPAATLVQTLAHEMGAV